MKTIGLIGGMSWESTVEYYKVINTAVKTRLGGLHSAKCLIYNVDFDELARWLAEGQWGQIEKVLAEAARSLERGGADFFLIATNTMHKLAPEIAGAVKMPLLHIATASAQAIKKSGLTKVGLLGTKPTMEMDFYRAILAEHGLEVLTPEAEDRQTLHDIIFNELCLGHISAASRQVGLGIIDRLAAQGASGMLLACTELGLLFRPEDTTWPLFDTAAIHALAAVEEALK